MTTLLIIVHLFVCIILIGVVLLQSGRAGGMGVLSGAATQTVFGGRGAGSFLQKLTAVCAILFMLTCSSLAYVASSTRDRGLTAAAASAPAASAPHPTSAPASSGTTAPAAPAPTPAAAAPVETAPAAPANVPVETAPSLAPAPAAPAAPAEPAAH